MNRDHQLIYYNRGLLPCADETWKNMGARWGHWGSWGYCGDIVGILWGYGRDIVAITQMWGSFIKPTI